MPRDLIPIVAIMAGCLIAIGYPLARAYARRIERGSQPQLNADLGARIERIEHAVDSIAIEVERISEGQRFTTNLLSEQRASRLPAGGERESQP
jgi:hypothetical protein